METLKTETNKPCTCPKDKRQYTGFIICHTSRENVYECTVCKKVH